jgi:uncharacterized protein (TIGR02996 family)
VTEAPTTTAAALLARILASPEDDAPRLVYADWLDEHGEPARAEFIRVQCELARTRVHPDGHTDFTGIGPPFINHLRNCTRPDCRACALRRRVRELWDAGTHPLRKWFGVVGTDVGLFIDPDEAAHFNNHPACIVRRGFADELRCDLRTFLEGECPACGGTGDLGTLGGRIGCNVCSDTWSKRGTGRAPGAAAVCRVEPVTKVVLVGCEPYENSSGQWQWYDARRTNQTIHPQSDLPGELWDLLKQPARGVQKDHPTRDDALDALSRACIRWARGQGPA